MKVLHVKDPEAVRGIYVGRGARGFAPSPLGNPFHIGKDGDRQEVIAKYRVWLWERIQSQDPEVLEALREIGRRRANVVCHCAPLPCHGEVVLRAAQWLLAQEK